MIQVFNLIALTSLLIFVSCSSRNQTAEVAKSRLVNQHGEEVGVLEVHKKGDGVIIKGDFMKLKKGTQQAIHIHEKGICQGNFESAKDHFSPHGREHGAPHDHSHAGDLGNLQPDKDGNAKFNYETDKLSLIGDERSVLGKSIIIHDGKDDFRSQPSGNAGGRFACGVIAKVE